MAGSTGRIFLSYRREETRHIAGRLADRLADRYGADQVFMDVDSIDPGLDFAEAIDRAVGSCDVLIALIGPQWTTAVDQRGRRRLDDPDDLVVLEVQTALDRNIRVIPVLTDGAHMPHRQELPEPLVRLARRNAVRLDHESFHSDAARLLESLDRLLTAAKAGSAVDPPAVPATVPDPSTSDQPQSGWRAELVAKRTFSREVRLERGRSRHLIAYRHHLNKELVTVDGTEAAVSRSWLKPCGYFDFVLTPERSRVQLTARTGDWGEITGLRIAVDDVEVYREGFEAISRDHYKYFSERVQRLALAVEPFGYLPQMHFYPNFDVAKLATARRATQTPEHAFVLAVVDLTATGSWNESLLLSDSGLYMHNRASTVQVDYSDLVRADISVVADTTFRRHIDVGGKQFDLTGMLMSVSVVVSMLEAVQAALRPHGHVDR